MPYVPKANKSSLRRTACDRCRMQKLKCLRNEDGGQPKCIRCTKLNVACEVGRAGRPGRPRKPNSNLAAPIPAPIASANPDGGFGSREAFDGAIQHSAMATDQPRDFSFGDGGLGAGMNTFVGEGDFATIGGADHYDYDLDLDLPPQDSEPLPPPPPPLEPSQSDDNNDSRIDPALASHQEVAPRYCVLQGGTFAPIPPTANQHECLRELSQLNVELHAQDAVLKEAGPESISLGTFVCATPPPVGDGLTVCERSLNFAQRLHRTMGTLRWILNNRQQPRAVRETPAPPLFSFEDDTLAPEALHSHHQDLSPRNAFCAASNGGCGGGGNGNGGSGLYGTAAPAPRPTGTTEDGEAGHNNDADADANADADGEVGGPPALDAPVVLLLVSCYAQLVGLLETIFHHIHRRLASLDTRPMPDYDPAKGVQLGVFYSLDGRLAGMVYAQIVGCLLDRIELGLGLDALPAAAEQNPAYTGLGAGGLLSEPRHFELLQRELLLGDEKGKRARSTAAAAAAASLDASGGGGGGSESRSARPRRLRDTVEKARLIMTMDASW